MAEATHLLGLPLKHEMKDIRGLIAELETFLKLDGSRVMTGRLNGVGVKHIFRTIPLEVSIELKEISFAGSYYAGIVGSGYFFLTGGLLSFDPYADFPGMTFYKYVAGAPDPTKYGYIVYNYPTFGGLVFGTGGEGDIIFNPVGEVKTSKLGNVTLLSNKIINAVNGVLRLPSSVPASPSAGDTYFDASTNRLHIYNGTAWVGVTLT